MKANQFKNLFQRNWVGGLACSVLALVGVLLASCNATVNPASFPKINGETVVNAGDIAFTGLAYNGNSQFSFVPTTNIAAGVSIFFTTYSYDPTNNTSPIAPLVDESQTATSTSVYPGYGSVTWGLASNGPTTIQEGTIAYIVGSSGLAAYSQVIIGSSSATTETVLQDGTVVNVAGDGNNIYLYLNHNGAGNKILAYTINGGTNNYVAAIYFGPDGWLSSGPVAQGAFWDSVLPSNLTVGTNAIDLSPLWKNTQANLENQSLAYANVLNTATAPFQNDNAVLNSCQSTLAGIVTASNWQADANEPKGSVNLTGVGLTACGGAGYSGLIP